MARKILLADDSVTAQNMGRKILTDAGYDVITVNNGSAALKRVAEQKPDLIVLDVYMPGYSGLEVCARLKDSQDTARIPILLTVGKLEPFKPEEATRVRADAFIVKPFEASELLSVLTRLEDRMVPAQAEGSRFGSPVSGVERFSGGDPAAKKSEGDESETGWKNRLRFPAKKKKEEPEPEPEPDFVTPQSFREFRQGGGRAPAGSSPFPLSTNGAATQEPSVVPDIPRDITPEELDALSDLAAKLDGSSAEEIPPSVPEATSETQPPSAPVEVTPEPEAVAPPVETSTAPAPVENAAVEAAAPALPEFKTEAAVAQEPAPVDRSDEPTFASPAEPVAEVTPVETPEMQVQAPGGDLSSSVVESTVAEPAAVEAKPESLTQAEEPKAEEAPTVEEPPQAAPVAASSNSDRSEGSSPSAEELAEALRFLTPSQAPAQTLAEAGAALANELARNAAGGGPRWIAEAVGLSPEEAAGSLESEMLRTFATSSSGQAHDTEASSVAVAATEARAEATTFTPPEQEPAAAMRSAVEDAPKEVAATTFADAVHREEVREELRSVSASAPAEAQAHEEVSSSEDGPGGQEAMGKDEKGKGGKSNWRQIKTVVPAASDAVEAAKATNTDEAPKAMAAAAAADGASDAGSIASIVDSVLADLRPKIVEEIAKKLAKK